MKHAAGRKFVRLFSVIYKPVNIVLHAPADEFSQGGFKAQRLTQNVAL